MVINTKQHTQLHIHIHLSFHQTPLPPPGKSSRKSCKAALNLSGGSMDNDKVDNYNNYRSFFKTPKQTEKTKMVPAVEPFYHLILNQRRLWRGRGGRRSSGDSIGTRAGARTSTNTTRSATRSTSTRAPPETRSRWTSIWRAISRRDTPRCRRVWGEDPWI